MALSLPISTPYGPASYHIVNVVNVTRFPSLVTDVTVDSFVDKAHRQTDGAQPLATWSGRYGADGGLDPQGPNLVMQAYDWVQKQPDWAGAVVA